METICDGNVCRIAKPEDFDLIIIRDMLQDVIDNDIVNGWGHIDLSVEEFQLLLRLVKKELS